MKITQNMLLAGLLSLPAMISGAALPEAEAAAEALAVAAPEPYTGTTALIKRETNGANCWRYKDSYTSYWRLSTWGPWDQDWGQGLLDNLRGQCWIHGTVSNWYFGFEQGVPPTNGMASWDFAEPAYTDRCVQDAIWLASNGASGGGGAINGVVCWESNKWW